VAEWAALKNGEGEVSFERSVGALDLFILDDAPEGDVDDVSAGGSGLMFRPSRLFQPATVIKLRVDQKFRSFGDSANLSTDFVKPTQTLTTSPHGRRRAPPPNI
jgi:hypothetical protein